MSTRRAALAPYGHNVYAYVNIRTKQVLYSLTRSLEHTALKQLPDAGANNTPASLRKDSWRPLFTLSLPATREGGLQGRYAMKLLKEWRFLHETCWTPPAELSRRYTKAEIKDIQSKLDERGGSKKETVYDLMRRQKKKIRAKIVMNQKENSIADLARVLFQQNRKGYAMAEAQRKYDQKQRMQLVRLARRATDEDGIKVLQKEIKTLEKKIAATPAEANRKVRSVKKLTEKTLATVKLELERMKYAVKAVDEARAALKDSGESPASTEEDAPVEVTDVDGQKLEEAAATSPEESTIRTEAWQLREHLVPFPKPLTVRNHNPPDIIETKGAEFLNLAVQKHLAPFTTQGATVYWADILDAEHADSWPANVDHKHMRLDNRGHTAGKATPTIASNETREQRNERLKQELEDELEKEVQKRWASWGETRRNEPNALETLRRSVRAQKGGKLSKIRRDEKNRLRNDLKALKQYIATSGDDVVDADMDGAVGGKDTAAVESTAAQVARLSQLKEIQSKILDEVRASAMTKGWELRARSGGAEKLLRKLEKAPVRPVVPPPPSTEAEDASARV